jgi:hypothetical protein
MRRIEGGLDVIDWYGSRSRFYELPTSEAPTIWRHSALAKGLVADWFMSLATCRRWDCRDWYEFAA